MRRAIVVLAAMAIVLVVASGLALADTISGDGGNNRLVGTNRTDNISGAGGNDDIYGKTGRDRLSGDTGDDVVYGGGKDDRLQGGLGKDNLLGQAGNDFANAIDGQVNDRINCGRGLKDVAAVDITLQDRLDAFARNCESIFVGIGPFPTARAAAGGSGTDLSAINSIEEAEEAEADGLLKQVP